MTVLIGYHGIHARQQEQVQLIERQIAQAKAQHQAQDALSVLIGSLDTYRKRLPPEADATWLAREAVALGEHAGVTFTSITQDAPQSLQQFTRLSVTLQGRATYHQLGALIDAFERSSAFIRVERVEVGPASDGGAAHSIRLILSTMFLPALVPATQSG